MIAWPSVDAQNLSSLAAIQPNFEPSARCQQGMIPQLKYVLKYHTTYRSSPVLAQDSGCYLELTMHHRESMTVR